MKSFYNRYWKKQDVLNDFHYKLPIIKKMIPREGSLKVLDFGCGKGTILSQVLKVNPSLQATGADVSGEALKLAKKRLKKCKFIQIREGESLPFRTGSFDFILACDVLEHIYDTEQIFYELRRILKKGGKILITVPYNGILKNLIICFFYFDVVFDPYSPHIRFYTKKSILKCLSKADLKPLQIGYFGRFFPLSRGMFILAES